MKAVCAVSESEGGVGGGDAVGTSSHLDSNYTTCVIFCLFVCLFFPPVKINNGVY